MDAYASGMRLILVLNLNFDRNLAASESAVIETGK